MEQGHLKVAFLDWTQPLPRGKESGASGAAAPLAPLSLFQKGWVGGEKELLNGPDGTKCRHVRSTILQVTCIMKRALVIAGEDSCMEGHMPERLGVNTHQSTLSLRTEMEMEEKRKRSVY
jgi:hypothetical protein